MRRGDRFRRRGCQWHSSRTPRLEASCAYCQSIVHTHKELLDQAQRQGEGFVLERCPACHRLNALRRLYGGRGLLGALAVEDGAPVVQGRLLPVGRGQ